MANIEIIVGTYEEFLLGYKVDQSNEKYSLVQSFADKSHTGAIKCLAVSGSWIASGATDDRIFVYDMKTRKQCQIILSHDGTVNALDFTPDRSHLLSGGADGKMIATNLDTWKGEGIWKKAHDGVAVTNLCCHPSGKLVLSLGTDLLLRSWNLIKGRVAYKTNLKSHNTLGSMPDCLSWSKDGNYFSLTGARIVEIWYIRTADISKTLQTKSKPVCVTWISDKICLVGLEDGKILWIDVKQKEDEETLLEAHNSRVKAIASFKGFLVTASSSGDVKLWKINLEQRSLTELALINIGCRPTCLGILDLEQFGPDYILTKTITELHKKPVTQKLAPKNKPRGVVTIEYENEESLFNKGTKRSPDVPTTSSKVDKTEKKQSKEQKEQESSEENDNDEDNDDDNNEDDNDDEDKKDKSDDDDDKKDKSDDDDDKKDKSDDDDDKKDKSDDDDGKKDKSDDDDPSSDINSDNDDDDSDENANDSDEEELEASVSNKQKRKLIQKPKIKAKKPKINTTKKNIKNSGNNQTDIKPKTKKKL